MTEYPRLSRPAAGARRSASSKASASSPTAGSAPLRGDGRCCDTRLCTRVVNHALQCWSGLAALHSRVRPLCWPQPPVGFGPRL
jgi:hypothetical protein